MAQSQKSGSKRVKSEENALLSILTARGTEEDLAQYDQATLAQAADLALSALEAHRPGHSEVRVDPLDAHGLALSAITVINDNMPFLFDSVLGEIAVHSAEPRLVLHPVLFVERDGDGRIASIHDAHKDGPEAASPKAKGRISLIHVQVPRLGEEAAQLLKDRIEAVLLQVRRAIGDWKPMLGRLDRAISSFRYGETPLAPEAVTEAVAFLEWLRDSNFTFLGMREFLFAPNEEGGALTRAEAPGLGILRDPDLLVLRRDVETATTTPEVRAFLSGPEPLIVTKANSKSLVHRRAYLDYIGVKTFSDAGELIGELRIVGLFTSTAYTRSVFKIPFLRSKAESVIRQSGLDVHDHSGKALVNVLESYPRDELFQVPVPVLKEHAEVILALGDRPRVRVLIRHDQFDRFVSVIVFVPRDRYDSDIREKIGLFLKDAFQGRVSAYYPAFPEGGLARVHFIIGRSGGEVPTPDPAALEAGIRAIVRTWDDALREAASNSRATPDLMQAALRYPASYRDSFQPDEALADAAAIRDLAPEKPIAIDFRRLNGARNDGAALKIFHLGEPVSLSRRVPMLENMGFRVISERTFELKGRDGAPVFIHDMELENAFDVAVDLSDGGVLIEALFLAVWSGEADNDPFNALVQTARLPDLAIRILRAYGRYLQQAGIPQNQDFVAATLNRYPAIAGGLWELFNIRLDPKSGEYREARAEELSARIEAQLDEVPSLDDDTILRRILLLVNATLRTNFFAPTLDDRSLAFKLDAQRLSFLPEPRPWREIFVYGPEVEGVHLRFGPVARGGLRWSDRAQDYRTEVLGLVKAQQVKNAVIVPVGAKGGFFPKQLPSASDRDAFAAAGKQAYVNFVSSLLSVTDNIEGDGIVPPENVVRHDADDPYFVVAADKGTATFSDTANGIAQAHRFWLDDAFASGGSAGYDHKKMGITARGAWEAVKRHFREMNRDIQCEPFTLVGVGDMGGDVFGNGMLLSPAIRLIAAFDHRHIFIDPEPDPAVSLAERQRLFALPRSSWADYDQAKLSKGGTIVARTEKSIKLGAEAAKALGVEGGKYTPATLINAILKAPVDLLWFGGIGTYVKASGESHLDAGDRANDPVRVSANEVRARVIGEGANLGVTQRARIEFGLLGGRCNSDAIDNSGGVNSSDVEVNIKIALANAMRAGRLDRDARNSLLASMTEEVADLVLRNNYEQTLALSLLEHKGGSEVPHLKRLMSQYEERGLLDRAVEFLPSPAVMTDRQSRGLGLTRAELGVLLAYAKIVIFSDLVGTDVPADPAFRDDLLGYFPTTMQNDYAGEIEAHRLCPQIVTRVLVNDLVNKGGPAIVQKLTEATGATVADVVLAFAIARDGFDFASLHAGVDALDNRIDGMAQLDLYLRVNAALERIAARLLKDGLGTDTQAQTDRLKAATAALEPFFDQSLSALAREEAAELVELGLDETLARRLARLPALEAVPDILLVADEAGVSLEAAARSYFAVGETFRVGRIEEAARTLRPTDYFDALALGHALDAVSAARRRLAATALQSDPKEPEKAWTNGLGARLDSVRDRLQALTEGGEMSLSRLTVAAGLMGDLAQARH